jgi:hypothetical protein
MFTFVAQSSTDSGLSLELQLTLEKLQNFLLWSQKNAIKSIRAL